MSPVFVKLGTPNVTNGTLQKPLGQCGYCLNLVSVWSMAWRRVIVLKEKEFWQSLTKYLLCMQCSLAENMLLSNNCSINKYVGWQHVQIKIRKPSWSPWRIHRQGIIDKYRKYVQSRYALHAMTINLCMPQQIYLNCKRLLCAIANILTLGIQCIHGNSSILCRCFYLSHNNAWESFFLNPILFPLT